MVLLLKPLVGVGRAEEETVWRMCLINSAQEQLWHHWDPDVNPQRSPKTRTRASFLPDIIRREGIRDDKGASYRAGT
jgi:hypothetical protein